MTLSLAIGREHKNPGVVIGVKQFSNSALGHDVSANSARDIFIGDAAKWAPSAE
jgi:hypothetical protein